MRYGLQSPIKKVLECLMHRLKCHSGVGGECMMQASSVEVKVGGEQNTNIIRGMLPNCTRSPLTATIRISQSGKTLKGREKLLTGI